MGKPTICIGENKGADQRLCFRNSDSTVSLLLNTFTATPLKKSISHCQAYIYFIVFIDLLVNLLIIIFLDICAYNISMKRAFYAEKSDIQYIYLHLKLSSITRDIPVYP